MLRIERVVYNLCKFHGEPVKVKYGLLALGCGVNDPVTGSFGSLPFVPELVGVGEP